jgi:hypothetical protein
MRGPLRALALAMVATLGVALVGLLLDPTVITGRPAWLKPAKFAVSTAIYAVTLLWMLSFVKGRPRLVGLVAWGTAIAFAVEMAVIVGQAARGRASHFNDTTLLDGLLFSLMGIFIVLVWVFGLVAALLVLRQRLADPVFAWSLRAGLIATSVGMLLAVPMIVLGGHTVGAPDGGPGLPVVGWSTVAGDLRPSHFLGLHAMQALPLVGWLLSRRAAPWLAVGHRVALVGVAGLGWVGLGVLLAWQALRAQPLLAPDALTLAALGGLALAAGLAVAAVVAHARLADAWPRAAMVNA